MHKIDNIVLTGGPCGGKTTAISYLTQKLEDKGFAVLSVPESATLCINGGINPASKIMGLKTVQSAILDTAHSLENIWTDVAKNIARQRPVIVIHDRGLRDAKAYMSDRDYRDVLKRMKIHPIFARDNRYGAVIHMRTAAIGAEEFYSQANNTARYETREEAVTQDQKTLDAWIGHPHLRVINNKTDFEGKLRKVLAEVCQFIGIPIPIEREKKFLVNFYSENIPENAQVIDIEQVYLTPLSSREEIRVRKRGQHGVYQYFKTIKRPHSSGARWEIEEKITAAEYKFGFDLKDHNSGVILKQRTCFVYEDQYFELDQFESPRFYENLKPFKDHAVLEIELTEEHSEVSTPPWIEILEDVTDNPKYQNRNIAELVVSL